jgi:hypothetical protein
MSKKPILVVERSRNDIEDQVNVTSTSLSDHAFWTPSSLINSAKLIIILMIFYQAFDG